MVGRGRVDRGIVGVATAVLGGRGSALAGLTVSTPSQRFDRARQKEIVEALLGAASRLGEAIGSR